MLYPLLPQARQIRAPCLRDGLLVFFVCIILLRVAAAVYFLTHLLVAAAPVVVLASFVTISRVRGLIASFLGGSEYLVWHLMHRGASWASGAAQAAQFVRIIVGLAAVGAIAGRCHFCFAC